MVYVVIRVFFHHQTLEELCHLLQQRVWFLAGLATEGDHDESTDAGNSWTGDTIEVPALSTQSMVSKPDSRETSQ